MEEPSSHRRSKSLSSGPLAGHSTIFTLKLKIVFENPCSVFLYWAAISTAFFSLTLQSHLIYQDLLSESTLQVGHLAVSTKGVPDDQNNSQRQQQNKMFGIGREGLYVIPQMCVSFKCGTI